jgi:exodeoxyribonuclease VII large subunit
MSRPQPSLRRRDRPILSVSDVTAMVRDALEEAIGRVTVEGEISNLRRPSSGHTYFTLKDPWSQLRCVLFRSRTGDAGLRSRDGDQVVVAGRLAIYEPRGEYQLLVDALHPAGAGELALEFLRLRDRLAAEGLFDPSRKKPLPPFPTVIALVTSETGAAVRDMARVLRKRWPPVRIVLAATRVQGEGAGAEIAAALDAVDEWGGADLVIVGRGGGSLEDLWAFNEEILARAIARCRTPVLSAVGHETDVTISDFVADLRAATPSAAAQAAVPDSETVGAAVADLGRRLGRSVGRSLSAARRELRALAASRTLARPQDVMDLTRQRLDEGLERMDRGLRLTLLREREKLREIARRLERLTPRILSGARSRLEGLERHLEALGPWEVLERGFSIVMGPGGAVLRSADQAPSGTELSILMSEGRLRAASLGPEPGPAGVKGETDGGS